MSNLNGICLCEVQCPIHRHDPNPPRPPGESDPTPLLAILRNLRIGDIPTSTYSAMRSSGLLKDGEYAEDETNPDFSHMDLPVYIVFRGGRGPIYFYGVYPDWGVTGPDTQGISGAHHKSYDTWRAFWKAYRTAWLSVVTREEWVQRFRAFAEEHGVVFDECPELVAAAHAVMNARSAADQRIVDAAGPAVNITLPANPPPPPPPSASSSEASEPQTTTTSARATSRPPPSRSALPTYSVPASEPRHAPPPSTAPPSYSALASEPSSSSTRRTPRVPPPRADSTPSSSSTRQPRRASPPRSSGPAPSSSAARSATLPGTSVNGEALERAWAFAQSSVNGHAASAGGGSSVSSASSISASDDSLPEEPPAPDVVWVVLRGVEPGIHYSRESYQAALGWHRNRYGRVFSSQSAGIEWFFDNEHGQRQYRI